MARIKILKTEVLNGTKKKNTLSKKKIVFLTLSLLLIISLLLVPRDYYKVSIRKILAMAGIYTEEIKSIEIESNDYNNPGSFKITKSAKWLSTNKVQITFDVDSIMKTGNNYKDIILVLDNSGSMDGEKLNKAISDSKDLVNLLLSNSNNRVALIGFNTTSEVFSEFTNNEETIVDLLDNITTDGRTNYNAALQNIDTVMTGYNKQNNKDVVALFLTDGYPNEETPSEIATYTMLKDKYPYLTINGIQYEMGKDIIDEIVSISDNQFIADRSNLNNVLIEAALSPVVYKEFKIEDYINTDYFDIDSVNDITTSKGEASITEESGEKKIVWSFESNSFFTGSKENMTINLTLNDTIPSNKVFYPTNTKEVISYTLAEEEIVITRTDTPVLTNKYSVIYDTNVPSGCVVQSTPSTEYQIYSTVSKSTNVISCSGHLFRGWKMADEDDSDIIHINENLFIMPAHDVTVRAEWTSQSITKSVDGIINTHATLYKVLKEEAENDGLAKEYTGSHQDSMDSSLSTEKIYYWYASNAANGTAILDKNNVIFADHCWQMIRTTDTGGVKMIYNGEPENNQCLSTRGTHVGYAAPTSQSVSGTYWYGTDYSYDSINKVFQVSGTTEQVTWNTSVSPTLVGKYTCKKATEDGTCSTIYLIHSVNSSGNASVYPINSNSAYSQFGKIPFTTGYTSHAYVGYMYGDVYNYSNITGTSTQSFTTTQTVLGSLALGTSYWYADSISYDSVTGKYSLLNPYQVNSTSDYGNLVGKYTFRNNTQTYTNTSVYYIANVEGSNMYYRTIKSGNLLSYYEPILLGDSITDNGDGTYTINNTVSTTLTDWYSDYSGFINKYTCNNSNATCQEPRYITATTNLNYDYIPGDKIMIGKGRVGTTLTDTLLISKSILIPNRSNYTDYKYTCNTNNGNCTESTLRMITSFNSTGYKYAPNHYYGASVTWDGTNYTLVNPIEIENYNNMTNISTHHYICPNFGEKVCSTVDYIFNYSGSGNMSVITLKNGVLSSEEALQGMFANNRSDSTMKRAVEAWYKKYMLEYDDMIEDTIFCNNRALSSLGGMDSNGGLTNKYLYFSTYTSTRNLDCTNITDRFSTNNPVAPLVYKVGLMTNQELSLLNNANARKSTKNAWLGTPIYFMDHPRSSYISAEGAVGNDNSNNSHGVNPAISLKSGTEYYTGDGSMEHPYIVDTDI